VLGALIFWVVFPGTYGLAILLLVLVIGLLLVDNKPGTELPERRETADLSLARAPRDGPTQLMILRSESRANRTGATHELLRL